MHPSRPAGIERRTFGRRQTNDHAIVRVPGRPAIRCVIKNISDGGALLEFDAPVSWLPFSFQLTWETGARREDCEIKHHNGNRVGVAFAIRKAEETSRSFVKVDDLAPWVAETHSLRR